jgi:putative Ca2+/H+ antiporter (TMEM165/GDT1 family)
MNISVCNLFSVFSSLAPEKRSFLDLRIFLTVFSTVFIAELGDKTQLATLLFSANSDISRLSVFLAASAALVASTMVAVLAGMSLARHIDKRTLSIIAGAGFVLIGVWTLISGIRTSA